MRSGIAESRLIGLFGGTFDPIHCGHLHAAAKARDLLGLAEVRLILSARPPHRRGPAAGIEDRWAMLTRATRGRRGLRADDRELKRAPRPSFTVDTLNAIRAERGAEQPLVWCLGWDAFVLLETWRDWRKLIELTHFAVFRRPGGGATLPPALEEMCKKHALSDGETLSDRPAGRVLSLEARMVDVSATSIRRRIAAGEDVSGLLPAPVWSYIRQHQLYGGQPI